MSNEDTDPILVVVSETDYLCYSLKSQATERDRALIGLFQQMGGVAAGTEPGNYHFNAEMIDGEHAYASLLPVEF